MRQTENYGCDRTIVTADELTEGDVVLHLGSHIQVQSEPEYTRRGIVFDALYLDVDSADNTQELCFNCHWRFELVAHIHAATVLEVA